MKTRIRKISLLTLCLAFVLSIFAFTLVLSNNTYSAHAETPVFAEDTIQINGASIRIAEDGQNGVRFQSEMTESDFNTFKDEVESTGMLFIPESMYSEGELEYNATNITLDSDKGVYRMGDAVYQDTTRSWALSGGKYKAGMYFHNIPTDMLASRFMVRAVAVMKDTGTVVQTPIVYASMAQVAVKAMLIEDYSSTEMETIQGYIPQTFMVENTKADFEVYSGISEKVPTANTITITEKANAGVDSAYLIDGDTVTEIDVTETASAITLSGAEFGSTVYGEKVIVVIDKDSAISQPLNVITKKLSTADDVKNLPYYGNIDATTKAYGGYFTMSNDIALDGTAFVMGGDSTLQSKNDLTADQHVEYDIKTGFNGTFDGNGYAITGLKAGEGSTGLFGNVMTKGVVKNVKITGVLNFSSNDYMYQYYYGILGNRFSGTMEDCEIILSATANSIRVNAFAWSMLGSTIKNTVIRFDTTGMKTAASGDITPMVAFARYFALYYGAPYKMPVMENVYLLSNPTGSIKLCYDTIDASNYNNSALGSYGHASSASPQKNPTGITTKGLDEKFTATLDTNYWYLDGDQPELKAPNTSYLNLFEVYSGVEATVPTANTMEIGFDKGTPTSVEINDVAVDEANWSFEANKLSISGNAFGSTVYGMTKVEVIVGAEAYVYKVKVVTKNIASASDLINMPYYGNIDAETKAYGGYFVLTNNITLDGSAYVMGGDKNLQSMNGLTEAQHNENAITTGFGGTLDGNGYAISGLKAGYGSTGLFGNVNKSGTIENVKITGIVDFASPNIYAYQSSYGILGRRFAGTIEGCEFNLSATSGSVRVHMFAWSMASSKINNTIIRFDTTGMATAANGDVTPMLAFARYFSVIYSWGHAAGLPTMQNVFFVTNPTGAIKLCYETLTPAEYNDDAFGANGYTDDGSHIANPTGLTTKGWSEEFGATLDANYWDLTGTQPVFKTK